MKLEALFSTGRENICTFTCYVVVLTGTKEKGNQDSWNTSNGLFITALCVGIPRCWAITIEVFTRDITAKFGAQSQIEHRKYGFWYSPPISMCAVHTRLPGGLRKKSAIRECDLWFVIQTTD